MIAPKGATHHPPHPTSPPNDAELLSRTLLADPHRHTENAEGGTRRVHGQDPVQCQSGCGGGGGGTSNLQPRALRPEAAMHVLCSSAVQEQQQQRCRACERRDKELGGGGVVEGEGTPPIASEVRSPCGQRAVPWDLGWGQCRGRASVWGYV